MREARQNRASGAVTLGMVTYDDIMKYLRLYDGLEVPLRHISDVFLIIRIVKWPAAAIAVIDTVPDRCWRLAIISAIPAVTTGLGDV